MRWTPQAIVAIILALTVMLTIGGIIVKALIFQTAMSVAGIDWLGKIILAITGGLLLYLGVSTTKEK